MVEGRIVDDPASGIIRYGTSRLGVCIDEDEQQGVPGCLRTSSRHDFPSFPIVSSTFQQIMPSLTPVEAPRLEV
uniref:Uncharacterized protein n=1 Tax=Heterorhabditis bacteriophora TaxID=37862 RepID=A0A1I7X9E9_HETBA